MAAERRQPVEEPNKPGFVPHQIDGNEGRLGGQHVRQAQRPRPGSRPDHHWSWRTRSPARSPKQSVATPTNRHGPRLLPRTSSSTSTDLARYEASADAHNDTPIVELHRARTGARSGRPAEPPAACVSRQICRCVRHGQRGACRARRRTRGRSVPPCRGCSAGTYCGRGRSKGTSAALGAASTTVEVALGTTTSTLGPRRPRCRPTSLSFTTRSRV